MKNLAIVVAMAHNHLIGREGTMPWHLPSDLKHFKDLTLGHPVVMGRNTFESLPIKFRPLPGRANIVLSRDLVFGQTKNITVCSSWEEARELVAECEIAFVMGGAEIYKLALPDTETIYQTVVSFNSGQQKAGDVFFPKISRKDWAVIGRYDSKVQPSEECTYVRRILRRR